MLSTANISIVVSNLYDVSENFGQPKRDRKISIPKFVPEQIVPVRILT